MICPLPHIYSDVSQGMPLVIVEKREIQIAAPRSTISSAKIKTAWFTFRLDSRFESKCKNSYKILVAVVMLQKLNGKLIA